MKTKRLAKDVWIWLDISAACNLTCRDCYTKHAHAAQIISPNRFEVMLRKLCRASCNIKKLHLNWRGEPLTNKKLVELLEIRKRILPSVNLEMHTNGTLVNDIIASGIIENLERQDLVYVSIDGGCQERHEANRGSGTWLPALRGLEKLLSARDQASRKAAKIGIYEIFYGYPRRYDPELVKLGRRCDLWRRVSPIGPNGEEGKFPHNTAPTGPCFWAGNALCITVNGEAHVCLLSFRLDGILGNVFKDDVDQIVDRAAAYRERLAIDGRKALQHCKYCLKAEGKADRGVISVS